MKLAAAIVKDAAAQARLVPGGETTDSIRKAASDWICRGGRGAWAVECLAQPTPEGKRRVRTKRYGHS